MRLNLFRSSPQHQHGPARSGPGKYQLRKFTWRSLLTLFGPLLVLGFYVLICAAFLAQPAPNDIVTHVWLNARWLFYVWFILVLFMLDWARAGLANVEAAALMHPRLAPTTAMQLMWHTDGKWANPLWWLRAIRGLAGMVLRRRQKKPGPDLINVPGGLWVALSLVTLLLFVSLPLSGLTMEIANVSIHSDELAVIAGPNETTFNLRMKLDPMRQIRSAWQIGRPTSPSGGAIMYAPDGTSNVSASYLDDQITQYVEQVEFFTGPAVSVPVHGTAWGMWSNISCVPVSKDKFYLLRIDGFNYTVKRCDPTGIIHDNATCHFEPGNPISETFHVWDAFPLTYLTQNTNRTFTPYWLLTSADGYEQRFSLWADSPYLADSNHDNLTFDSFINKRSKTDITTAMLEAFVWQSHIYDGADPILGQLTSGHFEDPVDLMYHAGPLNKTLLYAGVGVHCDIMTAVGFAKLDPAQRTFSSFTRGRAVSANTTDNSLAYNMWPPQMFAVQSLLRDYRQYGLSDYQLPTFSADTPFGIGDETFLALHTAVNQALLPPFTNKLNNVTSYSYPALTPKDLQLAMYRLLSESVIAMMDAGGLNGWTGELRTLKSATYLVNGIVSWKYVVAILGVWTSLMCAAALWMLFLAGPRWATSLDGFQMFKFGAQYSDEVDEFKTVDFQGCAEVLTKVPGMVGMLPGPEQVVVGNNDRGRGRPGDEENGYTAHRVEGHERLGFIGLSENVASKDVLYTLDRRQAMRTRP